MNTAKKIREMESELEKLRNKQKYEDKLKADHPEFFLADLIHSKICHWNHTDGCGYYYHDWTNYQESSDRHHYLSMARKILASKISIDMAEKVISAIGKNN